MEQKIKFNKFLSNSYLFYFLIFLIGVFLNILFPTRFLGDSFAMVLGFLFITLGTFLIFWIKASPKKPKKEKEIITKEDFMLGPYKYTSVPNHWGILFLMLGLGFMTNNTFIVVLATLSFMLTLRIFLKMQETVLSHKFGDAYKEYKSKVRF